MAFSSSNEEEIAGMEGSSWEEKISQSPGRSGEGSDDRRGKKELAVREMWPLNLGCV